MKLGKRTRYSPASPLQLIFSAEFNLFPSLLIYLMNFFSGQFVSETFEALSKTHFNLRITFAKLLLLSINVIIVHFS